MARKIANKDSARSTRLTWSSEPKRLKAMNHRDAAFYKYVVNANGPVDFDAYRQELRELWVFMEDLHARNAVDRALRSAQERVEVSKVWGNPADIAAEERHLREIEYNAAHLRDPRADQTKALTEDNRI